jgi:hypothetical protein
MVKRLRAVLAILMAVVGAIVFFTVGRHDLALRLAGLVLIMAAVPVARPRAKLQYVSVEQRARDQALAIKPWLLLVGVALIVATAASWFWLAADAATGGKSGTPVVVFAFVALVCGVWWAGLFVRWLQRRRDV